MARHTRRGGRRMAVAAALGTTLTATLLTALMTAPPAAAEPHTSRGVEIPAFYTPPETLPEDNGALVRSEPLPLGLTLPGADGPLPGTATRVMFRSTDSGGGPVAVTGAYIEPTAAWEGDGPRPLVVLASGTMGQGDQCAPSLALQNPVTFTAETISVGYELLAAYRMLTGGIAVMVTDYVGLGTPGRHHTYAERFDQAHAVLDAARAARALPETSLRETSRVGLYGYSQGGGATAAAAELQPSYAPELTLAGTYSGAPPADLAEVIKGVDGSALAGALGWSLNGLVQTYPEIKKVMDANIAPSGRAALEDLSTMCVGDAILGYAFAQSKDWTRDGRTLTEVIAAEPGVQKILARERIGSTRPAGPVRLTTGVLDDLVLHDQVHRLALDWCARGADVTYHPITLPNLGDGLLMNHLAPLIIDQGDAIAWLTERLRGRTAPSNCAAVPPRG